MLLTDQQIPPINGAYVGDQSDRSTSRADRADSAASAAAKHDYPALDLVRFAAAMLVAGYHIFYWWWAQPNVEQPAQARLLSRSGEWLTYPFKWGDVGVATFFVLSGFVIAFTAEGRTAGGFLRSRALRLYPAAWLCATTTLLVSRAHENGAFGDWARSFVLSPLGPWISGVYWSLSVEITFYLLVAAVLRSGISLWSLATGLSVWGCSFWVLVALSRLFGGPLQEVTIAVGSWHLGIILMLQHGCFFAFGMLIWSFSRGSAPRIHKAMVPCVFASCLCALGAGSWLDQDGAMRTVLWLVGIGSIILGIVCNERIVAILGSWRSPTRTLGLLTYPLYLVHSEVGRDLALNLSTILHPLVAELLALCSVLLLSYGILLSEIWLRQQLRSTMRRITAKQSMPNGATATGGALEIARAPH